MNLLLERNRSSRPAGPRGLPVLGVNVEFARNPLDFLTGAHRQYGNLVTLPLNGRRVVTAFGPAETETIVNSYGTDVDIVMAGGVDVPVKHNLQGRGPLNTSGAEHAFYRDVAARALRGDSAQAYVAIVAELTERMLDSWEIGSEVDLMPAMVSFIHRVFKFYMFGTDVVAEDPELNAAVDVYISVLESYRYRLGSTILPWDVPGLSRSATLRREMAVIDERIREIGAGRRTARYSLAEAFLSQLAGTKAADDASLVRELMLQMYFAGLTSVASTIVWTLLMLTLHPAAARRQIDEAQTALGGRIPLLRDLRLLPWLDSVINESMRLYPGSAFEFKKLVGPLSVGGYALPEHCAVMLTPWVTWRSAESFADPDRFLPERFADGRKEYAKGAFAPWGYGSRSCIGKVLARCAVTAVLAGVGQRYRLGLAPGQTIHPNAGVLGIRLLPRPGVRVIVNPQDGETERSPAPLAGTVIGAVPGPF